MSFEAKDYPISDILNKAVFDIPRNQRRYVWKKSSWQDLFVFNNRREASFYWKYRFEKGFQKGWTILLYDY